MPEKKNTQKSHKKTAALILAGGTGERFGGGMPKQYRILGGLPVLCHSIKKFLEINEIQNVFVVTHEDHAALYRQALSCLSLPEGCAAKLHPPVIGGTMRQESVLNGLKAAAASRPDYVLIHDAARPLVTRKIIRNACNALQNHSAVLPGIPVADTLKSACAEKGTVKATIDRSNVFQAQTPQGFDFRILYDAHLAYREAGATDDIALIEKAGITAKIIPGHRHNFKLTETEDFLLAEALLRAATDEESTTAEPAKKYG